MTVSIGLGNETCRIVFLALLSNTSAQLLSKNNAVQRKRGPTLVLNRDG